MFHLSHTQLRIFPHSAFAAPSITGAFDPVNAFLGSVSGEDTGRRLWAGPPTGSSDSLLPHPPALVPAPGHAAGAGLFAPLGGSSVGLLSGFDAMSLHPTMSPPQQAQQGGFGAMPSLPPMPPLFPSLSSAMNSSNNGVGPGGALPPHMQFQSYELVDSDEYASHASLRVSLASMQRDEANGSFVSKGALISHRGADDVLVRCWRKTGPVIVDTALLRGEVKALRMLSRKCAHIAKVLHMGTVDLSSNPANPAAASDLIGLVTETSELGTLDRFTANHLQLMAAQSAHASPNGSAPPASAHATSPPSPGFSTADLQSMCVQLIEGLIQCHEVNIRHRDIRPQNILISPCADKYQSRQFARGLQLKYANFTPIALLPLCAAAENPLQAVELDKWVAPEVDPDTRKHGVRFQASSDVWSLGLTIYYLATGGQLPFDSFKQACDAAANPDYRRSCLEKHGLQERAPMLYDLIERLVRPAFMRTDLQIIRCHPFLWTMDCRRSMLTAFANASMMRGSDVISNFVTGIDKISPLYVFGADGWVTAMAPFLLALVPPKLRSDFWWSGTYLLQAIRHQLQFPEALQQHVYPRMTAHQATHAYLRQVTEVDFPRLLILLYELGGIHGKWLWDGDEIVHSWN